jgi:anti-sigma factor ChrR (cupin superfamily)
MGRAHAARREDPRHDHVGGEEIFVLHESIEDEVALAKRGTWILFPVGFRHSPFSHGDGCIMIVREGDVRV